MEWFCCVASDRQNRAASDPETVEKDMAASPISHSFHLSGRFFHLISGSLQSYCTFHFQPLCRPYFPVLFLELMFRTLLFPPMASPSGPCNTTAATYSELPQAAQQVPHSTILHTIYSGPLAVRIVLLKICYVKSYEFYLRRQKRLRIVLRKFMQIEFFDS